MTEKQKHCIENMVLGFMSIDEACALCDCTEEAFKETDCVDYMTHYSTAHSRFVNHYELHFYTDLSSEDQVPDWDICDIATDLASTQKLIADALDEGSELSNHIIKTTQLGLLTNVWDYINEGFRVFVHNSEHCAEFKIVEN